MKETCDELGVKILAYSPLALGVLPEFGKVSRVKEKHPSGQAQFQLSQTQVFTRCVFLKSQAKSGTTIRCCSS